MFWLHSFPEGANVARPVVLSLDLHCPSENTCDCAVFVVRFCFSLLCLLHWMIALCKHALVCPHASCVHDGPPSVSLSGLPQHLFLGNICHGSHVGGSPPPSADVCAQRAEQLKMILSLSSITDQEKYIDVIASVQNWHDLYIHAFVNILAERTHGEPRSHQNKAVRDA